MKFMPMKELSEKEEDKFLRYRGQSLRLLQEAIKEIRAGRLERCEELLWGSLTQAVKGVALGRGRELDGPKAVENYAQEIGKETQDRRIQKSFSKLSSFSETVDKVRESSIRADHLVQTLEEVTGAVERLWDLAPGGDLITALLRGDLDHLSEPEEIDRDVVI